jgi:hypothetical protein
MNQTLTAHNGNQSACALRQSFFCQLLELIEVRLLKRSRIHQNLVRTCDRKTDEYVALFTENQLLRKRLDEARAGQEAPAARPSRIKAKKWSEFRQFAEESE